MMLRSQLGTRICCALICVELIFLLVPARASLAQNPQEDEIAAHELLWVDAAAGVLAFASLSQSNTASAIELKQAQARLERAVVKLINSRPPASRLSGHLLMLPFVQEVAAAGRALVDATEAKDEPGIASARDWVDQSLVQLAAAARSSRVSEP